MRSRIVLQLLLASVVLAMLLGHSEARAKTLRWANEQDVFSLDPYARQETFLLSFVSNIYEPLVRRGPALELEPALALRWFATAPDQWRFELRRNVRFQDGTPFTADDVVFSFARARGPGSNLAGVLAHIREVTKRDDFTVDIATFGPDPILPEEITLWDIMSAKWCIESEAEHPGDAVKGEETYAANHANGTGPFRVETRRPEAQTVLVPNPNWWDHASHNLDRVVFQPMTGRAAVTALLAGSLDVLVSVPPSATDRIARAKGVRLLHGPELRTIFLGFNYARDELADTNVKGRNPFRDRRVRQAFYQAIDERLIAAKVMRGFATPTALLVGPGVAGFDPSLNHRLPYDPAAARSLLAEAGFPNGFALGMDCPNDRYVNDEAICGAIVAMLAKIGVKLRLNAETRGKFFAKLLEPGYEASFFLMGWTPANREALDALVNLVATRNKDAHQGDANFGGYSNPELDALIRRTTAETDLGKRLDLIRQALALARDDIAAIPLHQQDLVWAARDNVELVQPPDGSFPLRYVQVK